MFEVTKPEVKCRHPGSGAQALTPMISGPVVAQRGTQGNFNPADYSASNKVF